MTYCLFKAFLPGFKVLLLPVHLKIGHLDMGIQDKANKVDTAVVEDLVPLVKILKASLEHGNNLSIFWVLDHVFPLLLHGFKNGEGTVNSGSGGMQKTLTRQCRLPETIANELKQAPFALIKLEYPIHLWELEIWDPVVIIGKKGELVASGAHIKETGN